MTLANGCARAAHYRHLRLEGDCELAPGVTFETCTVAGNVTAYGCAGRQLVCESGHVECRGTMQVAAINGHGRLCVGSDLLCESFAFVGDTSVNGAFVCSTSLLMIGRLLSGQRICSDAVRLIGVLEAIDLQVRSLCMEPLRSGLMARLGMREYLSHSHARYVVGITVNASGLDCEGLHAEQVELSGHSHVARLCSRNGYRGDGTSQVSQLDVNCDGMHLRPPRAS